MNNTKKKWYIAIGAAAVIVAAVVIYFAATYLPRLKVGKEIADLLQPFLTEENQSMHLDVSVDLSGELINLDSDIYMVKEDDTKYFVMEQYDFPIYIVDNILFLENGHAFQIAEEIQSPDVSYEDLFLQIAAAYEVFDITGVKIDSQSVYSVIVTGEQVKELLSAAVPAESVSLDKEHELLDKIEKLDLELIAEENTLKEIRISGSADVNGTTVQVNLSVSDFRILEAGEYVIPEAVKEAVATVDRDSLFNLTRDLYRLLAAFEQLENQESDTGTVTIRANCGIIDFENTYPWKDFEMSELDSVDSEGMKQLPAMIGFLCMEGEISCMETARGYEYKLVLDEASMDSIVQMAAPELVNYVVNCTDGVAAVMVENETIVSLEITIKGTINALLMEVPAEVGVTFLP